MFQVIYNHNVLLNSFLAELIGVGGVGWEGNPYGQPDREKAVLVFDDFPLEMHDFKRGTVGITARCAMETTGYVYSIANVG